MQDWINGANLTKGNSNQVYAKCMYLITEASIPEELGAIIPHAGICAGLKKEPPPFTHKSVERGPSDEHNR